MVVKEDQQPEHQEAVEEDGQKKMDSMTNIAKNKTEQLSTIAKAENELRLTQVSLKKFYDFYERLIYLKQQQMNTAAEFLKVEADAAAQMQFPLVNALSLPIEYSSQNAMLQRKIDFFQNYTLPMLKIAKTLADDVWTFLNQAKASQ